MSCISPQSNPSKGERQVQSYWPSYSSGDITVNLLRTQLSEAFSQVWSNLCDSCFCDTICHHGTTCLDFDTETYTLFFSGRIAIAADFYETLQYKQHGGQSQSRYRHDECRLHQFQGHWPHCGLDSVATRLLGKPLPPQVVQQTLLCCSREPVGQKQRTLKTTIPSADHTSHYPTY